MRRNKEKRKDMSRKSPVTKNPSDPAVKLDTPANAPSLQFKHHEVLFNEVLYRDDVVQANCGMWNAVRPQRFVSFTLLCGCVLRIPRLSCIVVMIIIFLLAMRTHDNSVEATLDHSIN